MNIKCLSVVLGALMLVSPSVFAQFYNSDAAAVDTATEPELAKPISLLDNDKDEEFENEDPDISYYVQNLNLSPKQLQEAQKISQDNLKKQEEIMQNIALLRRQARALEINSLMAFEAILDDTQKASFRELRAGYEGSSEKPASESKENNQNEENDAIYAEER